MANAYRSQAYDDSRTTARMSDLFGQQGRVAAGAAEDRAAIDSRKWQGISNIASNTMRDFVQIHGDYQQRKTADADRAARAARDAKTDARLARQDKREDARDASAEAETAKRAKIETAMKEATDPSTGRLDYEFAAKLVADVDPVKAQEFIAQHDVQGVKKALADGEKAKKLAKGLGASIIASDRDPAAGAELYGDFLKSAIADGLVAEGELPATFDRTAIEFELVEVMSVEQIVAKALGPKAKPELTRVRPGDQFVDADGQVVFKGPPMPPPSGGNPNTQGNTIRDDMRMAEQWKQGALAKLEEKFNEQFMPGEDNAALVAQHEQAKAAVQASYLTQIGAPAEPGTPRDQRNAGGTMRDLVQPPPAAPPAAPLGAGSANAAPTRPTPKVGDVITVRGQQIRITRLFADGTFDGEPVR